MKLKEIASKIAAHLERIEKDQRAREEGHRSGAFWNARSWASGRYVMVVYVSYQGPTGLNKEQATRYLELLDKGYEGKHYHMERCADAHA